jgi:hypothetical protein
MKVRGILSEVFTTCVNCVFDFRSCSEVSLTDAGFGGFLSRKLLDPDHWEEHWFISKIWP